MNLKSKRKNLTGNIRDVLYQKIITGEYSSGTSLASNKELAAEFGVSVLTADRAVRQLVEEGLVYREQGRGTFVSSRSSTLNSKSYRIGIGDINNFPLTPAREAALDSIPKNISAALKEKGCNPIFLEYEEIKDPKHFAETVEKVDALIISRGYIDEQTLANLTTVPRLPILVNRTESILELPYHQIVVDYRRGLREAAQKTAELNPPEIIGVYEQHHHGIQRLNLFKEELAKTGYPMERMHAVAVEEWGLRSGIPSYRLGMKLGKTLAGKLLFSTSDVVSFSMMEAFFDAGLKPGKDFQMLSVDNMEGAGYFPFEVPMLTSVNGLALPVPQRAADLILQVLEKPADESIIVKLPTSLVIRKTAFAEPQKNNAADHE